MKFQKTTITSATAVCAFLLAVTSIQGQLRIDPQRLAALQSQAHQIKKLLSHLPQSTQKHVSGGLQNAVQIADHFDEIADGVQNADIHNLSSEYASASATIHASGPLAVPVNNPSTDFLFSILIGFTQSETTTAWCGSNVVIGFNDSGSIPESILFGPGGVSGSGSAYSTDGGATFRDSGFINPGANFFNFLAGDPVVNCSDGNTFYFTQIFSTSSGTLPIASVAFSKSTNGGATWSDPVPAVSLDASMHSTDKPWSTVDLSNPKLIYVTYTHFDFTGVVCGAGTARIAIEIVHSTDGGKTWTSPVTVDEACNAPPFFPIVQGSQVQVDSHGTVYIAWEAFTSTGGEEMRIAKSLSHANKFQPFVRIDEIIPTGGGGLLQGGVRNNEFPSLAIDRTGTSTDGTVYVAWNDGRFLQVADFFSGLYGYANVVFSRSTDGGKTWSPTSRVNTNPIVQQNGRGTDQFQPGAAVDKTGRVAICWYDRSGDPANYSIGRTCGTSSDKGNTWANAPVTPSLWMPIKSADILINPYYLGDYDQLSSDALKLNSGFAGAFGNVSPVSPGAPVPNQDVFLTKLP